MTTPREYTSIITVHLLYILIKSFIDQSNKIKNDQVSKTAVSISAS